MAPGRGQVKVVLYTRPGCHLCDEAYGVLEAVRRDAPFELEVRDISGDLGLVAAYGHDIPVVTIDGVEGFRHRLSAPALRARLDLARGPA